MPIYEYRCTNGHTFEVLQSMSDDPVTACEVCGEPVERVFHPVAVHFKGSGFYTTDYAKKGANKSGSDGGSKSKADSKSEESDSKSERQTRSSSSSDSKPKEHLRRRREHQLRLGLRRRGRASSADSRAGAGACGRAAPRRRARTPRVRSRGSRRAVVLDGLRTSVPPPPPIADEITSWGMVSMPMLETIAFGAFQPMSGPLMKLHRQAR